MAEFSSPIMGGLRVARNRFTAYSILGRSSASEDNQQTVEVLSNNQRSLENVNSSLIAVSVQMSQLNASLGGISNLISQNSQLERLREAQKTNQQRKLAQQKLREGKESLVERKIQAALISPVRKVGAKAQFALSNLMGVFTTLLVGWLTNQVLTNFQFYSDKVKEGLESIQKGAQDGLTKVGEIFTSIQDFFNGLSEKILKTGSFLTRAIFLNIFKRPFDYIVLKIKELWNNSRNRIIELLKEIPLVGGRVAGAVESRIPRANIPDEKVDKQQIQPPKTTQEKDVEEVKDYFSGGIFDPNTYKNIFDSIRGNDQSSTESSNQKMSLIGAIPKSSTDNKSNITETAFSSSMNLNVSGVLDINKSPDIVASLPTSSATQALVTAPPQSNRIASASQQEPKQETKVIVTPAPTQQAQQKVPAVGGHGNDLPGIASSNPDNFYALYSQVNYNIVA